MKQKKVKGVLVLLLVVVGLPVLASGNGEDHFDLVQFIAHILNFIIFFGGLLYILRKYIKDFFTTGRNKIIEELDAAEKSREKANRELVEIDKEMTNIHKRVVHIHEDVRADAELEKKRILAHAEQEAAKILEQAHAQIESMRREAVSDLRSYIADKALDEAGKMVREKITDEDRKKLFADFNTHLGAKS